MFRLLTLCILTFNFIQPDTVSAQDNSGYIYGTIHTTSGKEYTGFMQWGKEEIYWHDLFNGNKIQDKKLFDEKKIEESNWFDLNWGSIWENRYKTSQHTFACYFGDIDYLDIGRNQKVSLYLKNGQIIKLNGGSNDIGATIRMEDYELGALKISWSKINKIDFKTVPPELEAPYGQTLFGKVRTKRKGDFEGYIAWDLDERHGDAVLDGDSKDGDKEIPFRNISRIEKFQHGSNVYLTSGREFFLDNSNDVDSDNRGIEVFQEGLGTVQIGWKEFESVDFKKVDNAGPSYYSFGSPKGLLADVETYDGEVSGVMIFDIDEMWEPEVLDGEDDYLKYQIPFRYIKEIQPKNRDYSIITLRDGNELLLGDTQDVSHDNDGLIIFSSDSKKPIQLDWSEILLIRIK